MAKSTVESLTSVVVDLAERAPIRVLHVDDETGFLKAAKACLEMQGAFQVDTALSVEEALEKMKKKTFDAIVCDYVMPGKDGLQFLKELRRKGNNIPFIVFTGKGREEVAIKALNLGADQYLNKAGYPETVYGELAHSIRQAVETRQAEEALRESEEKYRKQFEEAMDAILVADAETGIIIDCNRAASELVGREKSELVGKHQRILHPPEEIEREFSRTFKQHLKEKEGQVLETQVITKKGEIKDVAIKGNVFELRGKKLIQGIFRDITERKKVEKTLIKSEEMFKTLMEDAPICICNTDLKGKITYVNKRFEEVTGYSRKELVGKSGWKFLSDETSKLLMRRMKDRLLGKSSRLQHGRFKCKDGKWIWAEMEGKVIKKFGIPVGFQHIARDITERKRAEQAIQESQEKFERLFMNNPEAAVYVDSDFHVLDANPRFSELFGYSLDEIKGKRLLNMIVPEDKKEEGEMLDKEAKKTYTRHETVRKRKDGTLVPVSVSAAPVIVEGQPTGYVGLYKDITERKLFEERLSALNIYSQKLNMAQSMKEIYRLTLDAMEKTLGFEIGFFMVVDKDMLCIVDQRGYPRGLSVKLPLDGSKRGVSVKVATTGRSIIVPDAEKEDDWVVFWPGIRSGLDVPVKIGDKVLGVIGVDCKKLNAFDEKDQELLEILASHAATAISNREYAKNLETQAREIRENEEKFERLFVENPEAAVYTDSDLCILDINPRFAKLFGYSSDEVKGSHINDMVVPKDKMEEAEMFDKRVSEGETYQEDTVRKRKDGTLIPVSLSAAPIIIENKVIGHIAVYKDISQLKRTEKSLKETLGRLEMMNEKLGVVGKLTRHDARNKLSTVTMNIFLARQKLAGSHEALEHLSEIESACGQVERIFNFASTYEKLGVEELAYVNVKKSLGEAIMLFSDLHGVKVLNDCRGLTVLADSLLRQLFYNLIDNSLKHGEKISKIRVHYEKVEKDRLKLVYEDDGIGIPQAEKEKIFKEGYGKDTGYGLYLMRKMCEVYGWVIRETGKQGEGARFIMTIPKTGGNGKVNYRLHYPRSH